MEVEGIFDFMGKKELTSLEILYSKRLDTFLVFEKVERMVYGVKANRP